MPGPLEHLHRTHAAVAIDPHPHHDPPLQRQAAAPPCGYSAFTSRSRCGMSLMYSSDTGENAGAPSTDAGRGAGLAGPGVRSRSWWCCPRAPPRCWCRRPPSRASPRSWAEAAARRAAARARACVLGGGGGAFTTTLGGGTSHALGRRGRRRLGHRLRRGRRRQLAHVQLDQLGRLGRQIRCAHHRQQHHQPRRAGPPRPPRPTGAPIFAAAAPAARAADVADWRRLTAAYGARPRALTSVADFYGRGSTLTSARVPFPARRVADAGVRGRPARRSVRQGPAPPTRRPPPR